MGKRFRNRGIFVLDLVAENKMNPYAAYIAKSISLWHVRFGHVNTTSIERLKHLSSIPVFTNNDLINVKYVWGINTLISPLIKM